MQFSNQDVLKALNHLGRAASLREIAAEMKLSKHHHKQLRPLLKDLAQQGRVRIHQKLYELVPEKAPQTVGILDASAAAKGKNYGFVILKMGKKMRLLLYEI